MPEKSPRGPSRGKSISNRARSTVVSRIAVGLFFSVFLALGVGIFYAFFATPVIRMVEARSWTETSCEVLSANLRRHDGDEGSTWSVQVSYRFFADGQTHFGSRYKFVGGSTSGRQRKLDAVNRLRDARTVPCFYNPANPNESVLRRGPTADLTWGLLPLLFALVGGAGVWAAVAGTGPFRQMVTPSRATTRVVYERTPTAATSRLRPVHRRGAKIIGLTIFMAIWNGMVSVFLVQLVGMWQAKVFAIGLGLFLLPFVGVGLVLLSLVVHQIMAYFNPMPLIVVNAPTIPLGEELRLQWAVEGKVERLRRLTITLEGREEASYRRGTDTHTDRNVFARHVLVDELTPVSLSGGSARLVIPADSMHSFDGPNNKIIWQLRVVGDLANWPDSEDDFAITVVPRR